MTNELDRLLTITDLSETLKAETPAGVASSGPSPCSSRCTTQRTSKTSAPSAAVRSVRARILDDIDCHAAHHQADARSAQSRALYPDHPNASCGGR